MLSALPGESSQTIDRLLSKSVASRQAKVFLETLPTCAERVYSRSAFNDTPLA